MEKTKVTEKVVTVTPAQRRKRRKMAIMPLFFLLFAAIIWFIFSPSDRDKQKQAQRAGLNVELPMPKNEEIIGDKRDAYEHEAMQQKEQQRRQSMQDLSNQLSDLRQPSKEEYERQLRMAPVPADYEESLQREKAKKSSVATSLQSSAAAYSRMNEQLSSWYTQPATTQDNPPAPSALEERIQELERRLEDESLRKQAQEDQLAVMERSYQLAAKYMPGGAVTHPSLPEGELPAQCAAGAATGYSAKAGASGKMPTLPVQQVRPNVVSLLSAPMSDADFMQAYGRPRNIAFLTAAGNDGVTERNTIRACVYRTVTLTDGRELQLRLLEPMRAGEMLIPVNTIVTGKCKITGERMEVSIGSIQYADRIIPVELTVYDTDGQRGICVPGNDEAHALKEVASSLANSAGTSIMISDNAGSQLAADMGRGVIQGASQYASKKLSEVRVTLKANYRLLLFSTQMTQIE